MVTEGKITTQGKQSDDSGGTKHTNVTEAQTVSERKPSIFQTFLTSLGLRPQNRQLDRDGVLSLLTSKVIPNHPALTGTVHSVGAMVWIMDETSKLSRDDKRALKRAGFNYLKERSAGLGHPVYLHTAGMTVNAWAAANADKSSAGTAKVFAKYGDRVSA